MIFKSLTKLNTEEKELLSQIQGIRNKQEPLMRLQQNATDAIALIRSLKQEIFEVDQDASIEFTKLILEASGTTVQLGTAADNSELENLRSLNKELSEKNSELLDAKEYAEGRLTRLQEDIDNIIKQRDFLRQELDAAISLMTPPPLQEKEPVIEQVQEKIEEVGDRIQEVAGETSFFTLENCVIQVNDFVKTPQDTIGVVTEINSETGVYCVLLREGPEQGFTESFERSSLRWISNLLGVSSLSNTEAEEISGLEATPEPEAIAPQENPCVIEPTDRDLLTRIKEFAKLPSLEFARTYSWEQVQPLCDQSAMQLRDLIIEVERLSGKKRAQIFKDRLPQAIATYIKSTGDRSDLEWLPLPLVEEINGLLENPTIPELPYKVGEKVEAERTRGKGWQLSVITDVAFDSEGNFQYFKLESKVDNDTFRCSFLNKLRKLENNLEEEAIAPSEIIQESAEIITETRSPELTENTVEVQAVVAPFDCKWGGDPYDSAAAYKGGHFIEEWKMEGKTEYKILWEREDGKKVEKIEPASNLTWLRELETQQAA